MKNFDTCGSCAFWKVLEDEAGECRRHAPRPCCIDASRFARDGKGPDPWAWWTRTRKDDGCGDWKAKK